MATAKATTEAKKPAAKKTAAAKPKAAATKESAKKTVAAKKTSAEKKPAAPKKAATKAPKMGAEERYRMTEVAAYYMAERNGFAGNPVDYWTAAEAQVSKLLGKK